MLRDLTRGGSVNSLSWLECSPYPPILWDVLNFKVLSADQSTLYSIRTSRTGRAELLIIVLGTGAITVDTKISRTAVRHVPLAIYRSTFVSSGDSKISRLQNSPVTV